MLYLFCTIRSRLRNIFNQLRLQINIPIDVRPYIRYTLNKNKLSLEELISNEQYLGIHTFLKSKINKSKFIPHFTNVWLKKINKNTCSAVSTLIQYEIILQERSLWTGHPRDPLLTHTLSTQAQVTASRR